MITIATAGSALCSSVTTANVQSYKGRGVSRIAIAVTVLLLNLIFSGNYGVPLHADCTPLQKDPPLQENPLLLKGPPPPPPPPPQSAKPQFAKPQFAKPPVGNRISTLERTGAIRNHKRASGGSHPVPEPRTVFFTVKPTAAPRSKHPRSTQQLGQEQVRSPQLSAAKASSFDPYSFAADPQQKDVEEPIKTPTRFGKGWRTFFRKY